MTSSDPREFALARLAEEEADALATIAARGCGRGQWLAVGMEHERRVVDAIGTAVAAETYNGESLSPADAEHIARQDPAATLARVAALRALVEPHSPRKGAIPGEADVVCKRCFAGEDMETEAWPCEVIRGIAAIWPQDGEVVKL